MKQAEKGIRFITPDGKEKFRVADGDMVRITTSEGASRDRMARYIDDCHAEIGGSFYHIREFAEWMKDSNSKVIPIRLGLPEKCYAVLPSGGHGCRPETHIRSRCGNFLASGRGSRRSLWPGFSAHGRTAHQSGAYQAPCQTRP